MNHQPLLLNNMRRKILTSSSKVLSHHSAVVDLQQKEETLYIKDPPSLTSLKLSLCTVHTYAKPQ